MAIMTREEWDQAAADGHITPEHVMTRLKGIVDHVFGNQSSIGYDEDGFVTALTAEGLPVPGGVTLVVHSNDHPPPHVHIELRSHPGQTLRIRLDTAEFMDEAPKGVNTKRLKGLQRAIRENHEVLATWWQTYHGDPVVLS